MAENKKSFVAYVDWRETFDALPDDKAGQLIKHLFAYVNDENPQTDDILINAVFANIKQQLKRDLRKWEATSLQRSEIGRVGGLKSAEARRSKSKQLVQSGSKSKQIQHDIVNVNDNDSVNDKEKEKTDFGFVENIYKDTFLKWIKYKKARKEMYKNQDSLEACYNNLLKLAGEDAKVAAEIVEQSLANNWSGLFPLKTDKRQKHEWTINDFAEDR